MRRGEIHVLVAAGEAHGEPLLNLAAIASPPKVAGRFTRYFVSQPAAALRENIRLVGSDLLLKLAQCRLARRFAVVDAALRHLPVLADYVDPSRDEDAVPRIQQHDADAGAIALCSSDAGFVR